MYSIKNIPLFTSPKFNKLGFSKNIISSKRDNIKRKCGIIGIFSTEGNISKDVYEGLMMLQHRGQDSTGISSTNWDNILCHKNKGLVREVFSEKEILNSLEGQCAIGHVRYPTAGDYSLNQIQPFNIKKDYNISLVHNGNIINCNELLEIMKKENYKYLHEIQTNSDTEIFLNYFYHLLLKHIDFQKGFWKKENLKEAITYSVYEISQKVKGSYSCISIIKNFGLVAFRDKNGIRPLVIGKRENNQNTDYCIASEDCAFGPIDFELYRDVNPGELLMIEKNGKEHLSNLIESKITPCLFEYIYLARPDSNLNDISVYNFQLELGRYLSKRIKNLEWDIDTVVPVPDGSRPAAIKLASELNIKYREGLVRNRYVGRTFIMPDQKTRENSVKRKLNTISSIVKNKNILLVDDSIVRGTTIKKIIKMLKKTGANKIYVAIVSPPVRYPNMYGLDIPVNEELIAYNKSVEEIQELLEVDGLIFQSFEDIEEIRKKMNPEIERFEMSCFDGVYIEGDEEYLKKNQDCKRNSERKKQFR